MPQCYTDYKPVLYDNTKYNKSIVVRTTIHLHRQQAFLRITAKISLSMQIAL